MEIEKDADGTNNSEDYEEEELYLYLDFASKIPAETFDDPNLNINIIGLETQEPLVQVNSKVFRGTYEQTTGTNIFFEKDPNPRVFDPNYETNPDEFYKYANKSDKTLKMSRIFIEKKTTKKEDDEEDEEQTVRIPMSYEQALNQFLRPGENALRKTEPEDEEFYQAIVKTNTGTENKNDELVKPLIE